MIKVIHLIPYDGIGGVESAARSMSGYRHDDIEFKIDYIYPLVSPAKQRLTTFNPMPLVKSVSRIFRLKPDLLVVSLWRAYIVGILAKIFMPRLPVVLFLHLPNHVHWLDSFATRLMARLSVQIWADSVETLANRLHGPLASKGQVISFVTHRHIALPELHVRPSFIFWGRLHQQKGLERALRLFADVKHAIPEARFTIIGPDGGALETLQHQVQEMDLVEAVDFVKGLDFDGIVDLASSASFFLQTSLFEGMAMSVVEAMQLGLVPVVTPVGEIRHYCSHRYNALVVQSDESTLDDILGVLNDNVLYQHLRQNAMETWAEKPLYVESFVNSCKAILLPGSYL